MRLIVLLFCITAPCLSFKLNAQNTSYVKIYGNADFVIREQNYFDFNTREPFSNEVQISNYNRISIGLGRIKNDSRINEISFSISNNFPHISHESLQQEKGDWQNLNLSILIEHSRFIHKSDYFRVAMGVGLTPFWNKSKFDPPISTAFNTEERYIGTSFVFIPRILIELSSKLQLDINSHLSVYDFHHYRKSILNPQIPEEFQRQDVYNSNFFPMSYSFRIGFGYKFTS